MKRQDEYEKSGKSYTRKELDTMRGGENELAGSRSAARIQRRLRQMDRKDKRSGKR